MQSKATSVAAYLDELPEERRKAVEAVRAVILKNLGVGFQESMQYGMIGYNVPHSIYPAGYHCDPKQPLPYAALASQKGYMSLYMMALYGSSPELEWFQREWKKTGKKLDMGKCCIRFKKVEDLAIDVIGQAFAKISVEGYIDCYEKGIKREPRTKDSKAKTKSNAKSVGKKKVTEKKKAAVKEGTAVKSTVAVKKGPVKKGPVKKGPVKKSPVKKKASK